jgi:hypothetical protein
MHWRLVICLVAVACDGDSDEITVPGTTKLVDLGDPEIDVVCDDFVEATGPERTADCGGAGMVTVGGESKQECIDNITTTPATCPATVDDLLACFADIAAQSDADLCADVVPASCATLFSADC